MRYFVRIYLLTCALIWSIYGQSASPLLESIRTTGQVSVSAIEIINMANLPTGEQITTGMIQQAIKNLWAAGIFSNINIYSAHIDNEHVDLIIDVAEFPRFNRLIINGNYQIDDDDIRQTIAILPGMALSSYLRHSICENVKQIYTDDGFMQVKVKTYTIPVNTVRSDLIIDIREGNKNGISKITFHNNNAFLKSELLDVMQETRENNWFSDARFTQQGLERDLDRIVQYYQAHGYRDAEIIRDSVSFSSDQQDLLIDIWLNEGNLNYIRNIEFVGNSIISGNQLYQHLGFKKNDLYSAEKLKQAVENKLLDLYYDIGYLYASVTSKEQPVTTDSIDITFLISEKNPVKTESISITGNTIIDEDLIRRHIKVAPGEIFDRSKLIESQSELQSVESIKSVFPLIKPIDEDHADIEFQIREKKFTNPDFSLGWSQHSGLSGGIGVQLNNVLKKGLSGAINTNLSQSGNFISAELNEPWFMDRPVSAGLKIYYSEHTKDLPGYRQNSVGSILHIGHHLGDYDRNIHMDWIYRFDHSRYDNFSNPIGSAHPLQNEWPENNSSLTGIISFSSLDHSDFPTSGSSIAFSNEIAGKFIGGDANYHKHQLSMDWYTELTHDFVFRTAFTTGYINSLGKNNPVPYTKKFFLDNDRIYRSSIPLVGNQEMLPENIIGTASGTALFRSGLELRYRLLNHPLVYILTFAEAGQIAEHFSDFNLTKFYSDLGFGFRIDLPYIGIIGIDCSYGINYLNPQYDRQRGSWQLRLIIGNLF